MRLPATVFALCLVAALPAASAGPLRGPKIVPTHTGIAYGDHDAHRLDLWLADSERPMPLLVYIHGGGFRMGSRSGGVPYGLVQRCLDAGIACASLDYRLSGVAPYPAQMHDCARAVQFLRANAAQWNLDPERIAATGGSAGAGISLWLAFHDDLAQAQSEDPVQRQSTRLRCALPYNAQCTYDPRVIKEIVPGGAYRHPALKQLHGLDVAFDWDVDEITPELDAVLRDCSPLAHLSADDPPVWMLHYARTDRPGNIHNPGFGRHLVPLMAELGIPFVHRMDGDFADGDAATADAFAFLQQHLLP